MGSVQPVLRMQAIVTNSDGKNRQPPPQITMPRSCCHAGGSGTRSGRFVHQFAKGLRPRWRGQTNRRETARAVAATVP